MDILSKRDLCVLLTACICHDLDHPGYNNTYQINARTNLAVRWALRDMFTSLMTKEEYWSCHTLIILRYNDMSPLENHHCAIAFKILSSPECNIFTNLSPEEFKEVRGVCPGKN